MSLINVTTANCSFITTYPLEKILSIINASDNIGLYTFLERANELYDIEVSKTDLGYHFTNNKILTKLKKLFKKTINTVCRSIKYHTPKYNIEYAAVGLQEIANTESVFNTLLKITTENQLSFLISNIWNEYENTFPGIGYIINCEYKDLTQKVLYTGHNKVYSVKSQKYKNITNEIFCHSLNNYDIQKYISIRDLGSIDPITYEKKEYCLLKYIDKPDAGRPISMIIKNNNIHINCHVPNPAVLKVFLFEKNEYKLLHNKTIVEYDTIEPDYILVHNIWVNYCLERMKITIEQMLREFGINNIQQIREINPNWILNGDFNDAYGYLLNKLETHGINIYGNNIIFKFGKINTNLPNTCCMNTDSCHIYNYLQYDYDLDRYIDVPSVGKRTAFNRSLAYFIYIGNTSYDKLSHKERIDKRMLDNCFLSKTRTIEQTLESPQIINEYAFPGDNVGISFSNILDIDIQTTVIHNNSSDHFFLNIKLLRNNVKRKTTKSLRNTLTRKNTHKFKKNYQMWKKILTI